MRRYIDLEELEKRINENIKPETLEEKALIEWCKDECIRQCYAMPRADVVEVVRCKECKHRYVPCRCALWYACLKTELEIERADTVKKMQSLLHEKKKTIYCDENERLWYDIVELDDIDQIAEEMMEGANDT